MYIDRKNVLSYRSQGMERSEWINNVAYNILICSEKLHEGVIKDIERQQKRKTENIYMLQQQIDLTKQLKKGSENIKSDVH